MEEYDFIIIGGGCAGLSAAVYAARFRLKTLVIAKELGGLIMMTHLVENWPGEKRISGMELANKFIEHAKSLGVPIRETEAVDVKKEGESFVVKTKGEEYGAKSILFATGTRRRRLGVPGEGEFLNKGVSYCAACDAPLYAGKVVCVVGGSDAAAKEALLLSEYAKKVYIIYRRQEIRAEPINKKRVRENKKIEVIPNTNIVEIKGDKFVTSIVFDGGEEFALDGVFVEIGGVPQSELAEKLGVKLNEKKEIIINRKSETNVPGVFAAGDVCDTGFKQAIVAAAEGVIAAYGAHLFIGKRL